jgi:hypothetical protein
MRLTPEAGARVESRPGGPGPIVGKLTERFKPQAMHFAVTERTIFLVVDLKDAADVGELMVAASTICGQYPEIHAVLSPEEFADAAPKIMAGAKALTA